MKTKASKAENGSNSPEAYIKRLAKALMAWMDSLMSKYIRQDDNVQLDSQHIRIQADVPDGGLGHILAGGLLAAVDHVL